jgi:nucleotide-binding universal stress UspA family protein
METFAVTRILVPTDLSDSGEVVLRYARLLAERFGAELMLFYSDPIVYPMDLLGNAPSMYVGVTPEHSANLENEVRVYADHLLEAIDYKVVVAVGQPIPMILREAHERAVDLIVMGTHGLRGWRRALLGSVAEGVLHSAECPVLTVNKLDGHIVPEAVTRILCPVNFTEVARESLRFAAGLARKLGCELVIVNVVEPGEQINDAETEQRVRRWIAPEIPENATYRQVVLRGGAAERVLDCVEDIGADLLVIGAQHRLFRDATVIGTTSERLVRFARCPVVTVVRHVGGQKKEKSHREGLVHV